MRHKFLPIITLVLSTLAGCGSGTSKTQADRPAPQTVSRTEFNADSAFAYVAAQTAFGPRVPNTEAHRQCAQWLAGKLHDFGAQNVTVDSAKITAYDGTLLDARNITAQINPGTQKRILLLAHWDSRPWADQDPDESQRRKPIDGANDGASGVGVILEIVRQLGAQSPNAGVDILLVDAEDYGRHADDGSDRPGEDSWALGTQHWVQQPTLDLQKIRYAVLLDMVGGKDATFAREYFSDANAKTVNDKVWRTAANSGFADRFIDQRGAPIVDDHIYLLKAGIPAVDIIECSNHETGTFNPTWHTHADNIDNIDPSTLHAVGQTVLNLIYSE